MNTRWTEWTDTIMKAWEKRQWSWDMQGLSLHNYTVINWDNKFASVGFGEKEYAQILKETLKMEELVTKHSAIMDKYDPQKKIALVVDEWGAWYAPLAGSNPGFLVQQNSMRDAILAALNLNIFARHADRVRGANIAQMINVLQAMILTDKEKMVLTPSYYVFKMYRAVSGCDVCAGCFQRRHLYARRRQLAARGCHCRKGRERQAVVGDNQS